MLQGSLDTFGFGDVVTFLAATAKTGRLLVDGDRVSGSLWFSDGDVVAAAAAGVSPQADVRDVVFQLLRCRLGDFSFTQGDEPPVAGPPLAVGPLLEDAHLALDEWEELTAVVPSPAHVVVLAPRLGEDQVVVGRHEWATIAAVGAGTTVSELGGALGEGDLPVLRRLCDLLAKGLLELRDPAATPVPRAPADHRAAALDDAYPWAEVADTGPTATPEPEPFDPGVLGQLGGLSPRAAQAVSDVAGRDAVDDSVLMALLRDEV